MGTIILGIESSCDDTAAAISKDRKILANFIANQAIHKEYGGVVPELASRAHQQHIIPVIEKALAHANIGKNQLNAIAFTQGPGLLGSLLVGASFARSLALALDIPLIGINHMQAHILAHFIEDEEHPETPDFPFLCLTVSGGHTQIMLVKDYFDMELLGSTTDDAAGEAFDKAAKIMGIPYPGGPLIDQLAGSGHARAYTFPKPSVPGLDFSFSGLKTAFLYFVRDRLKEDPDFISKNQHDLAASIQFTIVEILMAKVKEAVRLTGVRRVAIAGGVSANSALRKALLAQQEQGEWEVFIPRFAYCTDNAAMIAVAAYFKHIRGEFSPLNTPVFTRYGS